MATVSPSATRTPPASAPRPFSVHETSETSPDVLFALSKDFARQDVLAGRQALADARFRANAAPKRITSGNAFTLVRLSRVDAYQVRDEMEQQNPAMGEELRRQLDAPLPLAGFRAR